MDVRLVAGNATGHEGQYTAALFVDGRPMLRGHLSRRQFKTLTQIIQRGIRYAGGGKAEATMPREPGEPLGGDDAER